MLPTARPVSSAKFQHSLSRWSSHILHKKFHIKVVVRFTRVDFGSSQHRELHRPSPSRVAGHSAVLGLCLRHYPKSLARKIFFDLV